MIKEAVAKLVEKEDLTSPEAEAVTEEIMSGQATPSHAVKVTTKRSPVVDTCGTGGDGAGTFNVSTSVAFVAAGAGLAVAKHGNRSISSRCGSADVLEALGARIDLGPEDVAKCLDELCRGCLFAPRLHPAMRCAAAPRREIGTRTIFNVLGPLTNPASASIQLLGVYDPSLTETMAKVLGLLGISSALVVHGAGGLDELSVLGLNRITRCKGGQTTTYYLDPRD
ncbi:MAG: anthranilate phosphoribosyltransferase, partial [Chloroflexi bacterium]|nr:anthranilate phosphoribosyltransferase [Chloroflexota bacterium]